MPSTSGVQSRVSLLSCAAHSGACCCGWSGIVSGFSMPWYFIYKSSRREKASTGPSLLSQTPIVAWERSIPGVSTSKISLCSYRVSGGNFYQGTQSEAMFYHSESVERACIRVSDSCCQALLELTGPVCWKSSWLVFLSNNSKGGCVGAQITMCTHQLFPQ